MFSRKLSRELALLVMVFFVGLAVVILSPIAASADIVGPTGCRNTWCGGTATCDGYGTINECFVDCYSGAILICDWNP